MNLEKLVQRRPLSSHRCIPITDSAESNSDSDLEDGELRRMLASLLYMQSREDYESSRMPIARGKHVALLQEREQVQGVLEPISEKA